MGGGSSRNNVQNIRLDQEEKTSAGGAREKDATLKSSARTPGRTPDHTSDPTDLETNQADEIATLTSQLCESESQRLDLEDRVQVLEERLEYVNAQNLLAEDKPCEETLHAKDQYIFKLEKEKQELQTEMNKMKQRQRRKLKQLTSQLTEHKQESNFQMMELRDEMSKVQEENRELIEKMGSSPNKASSAMDDAPKLPGGEKMKLILELSEQVTEQGDKLGHLERKVKERDQIIEELRVKLRNNAEYLKAVDAAETSARNSGREGAGRQRLDGNDRQSSRQHNSAGNVASKSVRTNRTANGAAEKSSKDADIDALFAVTEEDDDDFGDTDSLQKLSFLLHGANATNKKPIRDGHNGEVSVRPPTIGPIEESTETSNGRDSGLGSAGKREKAEAADPQKDLPDWKDFESGLSDSDGDQNQYLHSKVASAPPKLQYGGGQKLKKKSTSLRQRASNRSKDRPPRPGLAFVNNSDMSDGSLSSVYSISKDISRVEVS